MNKILIIDDDLIYRTILKKVFQTIGEFSKIDLVDSIPSAIKKLKETKYDLIILDYVLPIYSGENAILEVKKIYPDTTIVLLSSKEKTNITANSITLSDFYIKKPSNSTKEKNFAELKIKLNSVLRVMANKKKSIYFEAPKEKPKVESSILIPKRINNYDFDLVLITCSTGGPRTLEIILSELKPPKIPMLIVQHMPKNFTNYFAENISKRVKLDIREAISGSKLEKKIIHLAKGGTHLVVGKNKDKELIILNNEQIPYVNSVKPSADVTFEYVANVVDKNMKVLVVVLTGIGQDGKEGIKVLKEQIKNTVCVTENKESCVIYGMPKSVNEAGLSDATMTKESINTLLRKVVN